MAGTPTLPPKSPASGGRTFFFYGFFADPGTIGAHVDSLSGLLPEGATEIIRDQLTRVAAHGKSTLGLTFAFGLLLSLWSANAAAALHECRCCYSTDRPSQLLLHGLLG